MDSSTPRTSPTDPEYTRVDYGSADYVWEPTYSEAPDYEARAAQQDAHPDEQHKREEAFLYETPEWERPQFEPPHFDSGRHPGWDAGFASDARTDDTIPPQDDHRHPHWRSIPRAE